jgi:hypothetical protein
LQVQAHPLKVYFRCALFDRRVDGRLAFDERLFPFGPERVHLGRGGLANRGLSDDTPDVYNGNGVGRRRYRRRLE